MAHCEPSSKPHPPPTNKPAPTVNGHHHPHQPRPQRSGLYTLKVLIRDEHMRRTLQRGGYRLCIGDATSSHRHDRNDYVEVHRHRVIHPRKQPLVGESSWVEATFEIEPQPTPRYWIGYRTEADPEVVQHKKPMSYGSIYTIHRSGLVELDPPVPSHHPHYSNNPHHPHHQHSHPSHHSPNSHNHQPHNPKSHHHSPPTWIPRHGFGIHNAITASLIVLQEDPTHPPGSMPSDDRALVQYPPFWVPGVGKIEPRAVKRGLCVWWECGAVELGEDEGGMGKGRGMVRMGGAQSWRWGLSGVIILAGRVRGRGRDGDGGSRRGVGWRTKRGGGCGLPMRRRASLGCWNGESMQICKEGARIRGFSLRRRREWWGLSRVGSRSRVALWRRRAWMGETQNGGFHDDGDAAVAPATANGEGEGFQNKGFQDVPPQGYQNPGFQNQGLQNHGFQPQTQPQTPQSSGLKQGGFQPVTEPQNQGFQPPAAPPPTKTQPPPQPRQPQPFQNNDFQQAGFQGLSGGHKDTQTEGFQPSPAEAVQVKPVQQQGKPGKVTPAQTGSRMKVTMMNGFF